MHNVGRSAAGRGRRYLASMLWEAVTKSVDPKMLACMGAIPGQVRVASRCMLLAAAAL